MMQSRWPAALGCGVALGLFAVPAAGQRDELESRSQEVWNGPSRDSHRLKTGATRDYRTGSKRKTHIRAGAGQTIVAIEGRVRPVVAGGGMAVAAAGSTVPPRPRLVGFSPRAAIITSDAGNPLGADLEFEHQLESLYVGSPLNPAADPDFVIGFLDSGSDVNLAAGSSAVRLGLSGFNLTNNSVPIGGVGGEVPATITMPVGFFAAGLSAVDRLGRLDRGALMGHSNVCGLAAPAIGCGEGEVVTAVMGMPFLAFHTMIVRVDTPHEVTVGGVTYTGPDVDIRTPFEPLPFFDHLVFMEFGGLSPLVTTANYFPDIQDIFTSEPIIPTLLSLIPGTIPSGGAFFATIFVLEGEPGPFNTAQPMRVLVDTGAQSSIMSRGMAANLNMPLEPDFTVAVCGVGGLVPSVPAYYVDRVKINAQGGALEFSRAPFVVLDLPSQEGGTLDGILGMNFFWNRNVIFEPNLGGSGFFHVSEPLPVPFGDTDVDFDVDADDAAFYLSCVSGPGTGHFPECDHLDADLDGDNDLLDFARFQRCFSGADNESDPACLP